MGPRPPRSKAPPSPAPAQSTPPPAAAIRIGTQGWNHTAWVGSFYPQDTRASDFLSVYARAFDTVEVDATLYSAPSATTLRGWADRVPADFTFALKMPQDVTHDRRLRDASLVADEFFDRVRGLGTRLGPILMQFAPDFGPSEFPALAAFLPTVPRDVRLAVEFRHRGWVHDGVLALLAEHNVAFVLTDARYIPVASHCPWPTGQRRISRTSVGWAPTETWSIIPACRLTAPTRSRSGLRRFNG